MFTWKYSTRRYNYRNVFFCVIFADFLCYWVIAFKLSVAILRLILAGT